MEDTIGFIFFWGVWLLVPILIDGTTVLASALGVLVQRWRDTRSRTAKPHDLPFYPFITVILPIYNSADTLEPCLRSIVSQTYPLDRVEVLLLNNGSRDNSFEVFNTLQAELPLHMHWHSIINQGKAWAMNAGIHLASGQYIFNVDSDVVLSPDALLETVRYLEAHPKLGAITGAIQVMPPPQGSAASQKLLAACEFYEYLTAFLVGRQYQSLLANLYTLSGAFSVFRREVLLQTYLYSQETVTEDTDLTFELYHRFQNYQVGCVCSALAYVHPIESLSRLYAQRVRWQRGQLEVSARYHELMRRPVWKPRGFNPARVLMIDHTLSFPRLLWTFFLPVLMLFDYPLQLIVTSLLFMYLFYTALDLLWAFTAYLGADSATRQRALQLVWVLPILPLYRMIVFWFRFSGFLHASAEPGQLWRVQDPWTQIRTGWKDLQQRLRDIRSK